MNSKQTLLVQLLALETSIENLRNYQPETIDGYAIQASRIECLQNEYNNLYLILAEMEG